MEYSKNPFTPTFGSVPPFLAGREHILRDINRGFINGPGDPNLSTIFTGARGTGNWRTRMNGIFKQLEKHDIGLLITIDEVTVDLE